MFEGYFSVGLELVAGAVVRLSEVITSLVTIGKFVAMFPIFLQIGGDYWSGK